MLEVTLFTHYRLQSNRAMASLWLSLVILSLSVLSAAAQPPVSSPPPPPESLINAMETLARSGYLAMSLVVQLIAPSLPLRPQTAGTLTIFAPRDSSFSFSGQPSIAQLLLHFSPIFLSPASLASLPFSSNIPSLSPSNHLIVTSNSTSKISIDNVGVSDSPIYDDGSVIVYGIDGFFPFNFTLPVTNTTQPSTETDSNCFKVETPSRFEEASEILKTRGYAMMATFLDLQMMGFLGSPEESMKWTLFAPVDEELVTFSWDFLGYSSLFMRHLVPCRVRWSELVQMTNSTMFSNNLMGFTLEASRDDNNMNTKVNGVEITFPDMYASDWLVIHGIGGVIPLPQNSLEEEETDSPSIVELRHYNIKNRGKNDSGSS